MLNSFKSRNNKEIHGLLILLSETYKKRVFFKRKKVETLKHLIKSNNYHVSGKDVVDKWFSEESAF